MKKSGFLKYSSGIDRHVWITNLGWFVVRCFLFLSLLTLPVAVKAQFTCITNNNQISIIRYTGYSKELVIPNTINGWPVTSISRWAFSDYGSRGFTNINIPGSITNIEISVFDQCEKLASINVDESNLVYTSIDGVLFNKFCSIIIRFPAGQDGRYSIPNTVTNIDNNAFSACRDLTNITIPNSVTSIRNGAFSSCSGLTSITIPNSVTSIGNGAFSYCSGLTSITIPNSVTSIGNGVFSYCSGLTTINVDSTNSEYRSIDGVLFDKNSTSIIQFPAGKSGNYPIPQTVTSIHDNAFSGCRGVTNITIPNNVTSIGSDAFSSCHSLKNIIIPNSVTNIGEYAFVNCYGLTNITIPNSVASIGARAFYACKGLINFTIPNGLTSINESLFAFCSGLKSITIPSSVTKIGDSAFDRCIELVSVHFLGNAPTTSGGVFSGSEKVVVYFDIEKTGWATSLDGRPTKLWPSYLPAIMIQPLRIKALTSQSGILSIVAEGPAPITYQWHKEVEKFFGQYGVTSLLYEPINKTQVMK